MPIMIAPLNQRFGWELNGALLAYDNWGSGELQIQPFPVAGLVASSVNGYDDYLAAPFIDVPPGESRNVDSDAYIPVGTKATMVLFEYDAYDWRTGEWMWTPTIDLFQRDAIWKVDLGQYVDDGFPESPPPPLVRKVRVRKVLRQSRTQDGTWSAPAEIPLPRLFKYDASGKKTGTWGDDVPTFNVPPGLNWSWGGVLGRHPMIVLLDGLSAAAKPRENLDDWKYQDRITIYPGKPGLTDALRQSWAGNECVFQLTIEAMRLVYQVT